MVFPPRVSMTPTFHLLRLKFVNHLNSTLMPISSPSGSAAPGFFSKTAPPRSERHHPPCPSLHFLLQLVLSSAARVISLKPKHVQHRPTAPGALRESTWSPLSPPLPTSSQMQWPSHTFLCSTLKTLDTHQPGYLAKSPPPGAFFPTYTPDLLPDFQVLLECHVMPFYSTLKSHPSHSLTYAILFPHVSSSV